jgi:hypothetical protein
LASLRRYWLGSQATGGQPVYRYRLHLPFDERGEKSCYIQTDMDFNVDGEVKFPLSKKLQSKVSFAVGGAIESNRSFPFSNSRWSP